MLCNFAHLYKISSETIYLLIVGTNYAPINSEKLTTELNGLHYTELEKLRI
jgi:hypothetical protein